jgi:hypothetical protein
MNHLTHRVAIALTAAWTGLSLSSASFAQQPGQQAVFRVVQPDPHAHLDAA